MAQHLQAVADGGVLQDVKVAEVCASRPQRLHHLCAEAAPRRIWRPLRVHASMVKLVRVYQLGCPGPADSSKRPWTRTALQTCSLHKTACIKLRLLGKDAQIPLTMHMCTPS